MKTTETTPNSPDVSPQQAAVGISRRQIVRAGLSAAPVVAVLKSNSVLAAGNGNGLAPSAFASMQANQGRVSTGRSPTTAYQVRSPAQWLAVLSPAQKATKVASHGFDATRGGRYPADVTVVKVLQDTHSGTVAKLARYVMASYLTADQFNRTPEVLALTKVQCKSIWEGQGFWIPFAGASWTDLQTIAYFETIYGI